MNDEIKKSMINNKVNPKHKVMIKQNNATNSKFFTFYSLKKNYSDFSSQKSQLSEKKNFNKNIKKERLKLDPIIFKNLSNLTLKYNSELNSKKKLISKSNNILSKSLGNDLDILYNKNNILNKRLQILNRIKKEKINLDTIEFIKRKYGNNIFIEKYEKKYQQKERPIHYFFRKKKSNIQSLSIYKSNNNRKKKLLNFPIYETIEFKDQKAIYANKLNIEEHDKISNFNFYSFNNDSNSNKFISGYSTNRLKSEYLINLSKNKKYKKNSDINIKELKSINNKNLEQMRINYIKSLKKSFIENSKIIKINRIKYNFFIDKIAQIFNKQKEEVIKNNL